MTDLMEFLQARLDEDERNARDHLCLNCGNPVVPLGSALGITGYTHDGGRVNDQGQWEQGWEGQRCPGKIVGAEPVQNPKRVLAEVEAKRRIIDAEQLSLCALDVDPTAETIVLLLLASIYSDHPGYRPEWTPEEGGST